MISFTFYRYFPPEQLMAFINNNNVNNKTSMYDNIYEYIVMAMIDIINIEGVNVLKKINI